MTGAARTILDICASTGNPQIHRRALDDALRKKLVAWPQLWACHDAHARQGVRGIPAFRAQLRDRAGKAVTDTWFETRVQMLLVEAGLPEPLARHKVVVGGVEYRLDLAYPRWLIDIEGHSREWHLNEVAFEADPVRDNGLAGAGWIVLHVTHRRLEKDPAGVVADVRTAVERRQSP